MLVLSRKTNERIMIDGGIVITIVRTGKGRIRLGIEAPKDVRILREELLDTNNVRANEPTSYISERT